MPRKPTQAQCKVLAGSPLILAASDEQRIREEWKRMERVYRAAMRFSKADVAWREGNGDAEKLTIAEHDLHKACAAARKK